MGLLFFLLINCDNIVFLLSQSIHKGLNRQGMISFNGIPNNHAYDHEAMSRQVHHSIHRNHRPEVSKTSTSNKNNNNIKYDYHHTLNHANEIIKRRLLDSNKNMKYDSTYTHVVNTLNNQVSS